MSKELVAKYENTSLTEVEVKDIRFLRDMKFKDFDELRETARKQEIPESLVDVLEAEVEWMKEKGYSSIIIDPDTGLYMLPASEETLFQQVIVDDDGVKKPASIIVNPIILSKIIELKQEKEKRKTFLAKHGGTRGAKIFEKDGFEEFKGEVMKMDAVEGFDKDVDIAGSVIFGEENFMAENQGYNPKFSRYDSFLAVVKRELKKVNRKVVIKDICRVSGSKKVFYRIEYGFKKHAQLGI